MTMNLAFSWGKDCSRRRLANHPTLYRFDVLNIPIYPWLKWEWDLAGLAKLLPPWGDIGAKIEAHNILNV